MLLGVALLCAGYSTSLSRPVAKRRCVAPISAAQQEVSLDATLDDARTDKLFAWISRALDGDLRYNSLMLAFASIFSDSANDEPYKTLVDTALASLPAEDALVGDPASLRERERGSLGAMGAGQWTGRFRTRPHALLDVRELTSVDDWAKSLPRGARRTLAKANAKASAGDFSVATLPILGDAPAPHSSLAHFRCVLAHEVRLLADTPDEFFGALSQAIGRYTNCISQAGEIREYRNAEGKVIAFAQEATKGRVIRGQWYYATDEAASSFVWFHSVQELVRRAVEDDGVDFADLGPSGTDAFSELKEKYGFASVADWHKVADYRGPFRYDGFTGPSWASLDPPDWLFEADGEASLIERMLGRRNL